MELIAQDIGGKWFFDGGKTYFCKNKQDVVVGKIYAEYVPDPVGIWKSKCEAAGIEFNSQAAQDLKPNDVVFKLWEHKRAKFNQ